MSALQVLRRLGSIFTSVYATVQKLKKDSWKELQLSLVNNSKLNVAYPLNRRLRATSSVRRPSNKDSSFKNSVLSNTKNSLEKLEVSDRTNKKPDVAFKNVALNNNIITNDDIKKAPIAKNVLCVSCAKNVLIPCHDNCLVKYKFNMDSNVRRALFTSPRTVKSTFEDKLNIQSKSLDTTPVVSKTKIVVVTPLSAKNRFLELLICETVL
ncbi:hypothetical protein Tco_1341075 [Tanacetum coccineum]